jgi:hypothetical protein
MGHLRRAINIAFPNLGHWPKGLAYVLSTLGHV